jgi:hypothetical protein
MHRIGLTGLVAAVALVLAAPAVSFNPQPDPPGFEALLREIRALPAVQNGTPFLAKVFAAGAALERGQACTSLNILGALDHQLDAKAIGDSSLRGVQAALDAKIADVSASCPSD